MPTGMGEEKVILNKGAKTLQKFADLPSIKKKIFLEEGDTD